MPLQISLYDNAGNARATYTQAEIPRSVLKKAMAFALKVVDSELEMSESDVNFMGSLIVEVFDGQFTMQDLESGADLNEILQVLYAIAFHAGRRAAIDPSLLPPPILLGAKKAEDSNG